MTRKHWIAIILLITVIILASIYYFSFWHGTTDNINLEPQDVEYIYASHPWAMYDITIQEDIEYFIDQVNNAKACGHVKLSNLFADGSYPYEYKFHLKDGTSQEFVFFANGINTKNPDSIKLYDFNINMLHYQLGYKYEPTELKLKEYLNTLSKSDADYATFESVMEDYTVLKFNADNPADDSLGILYDFAACSNTKGPVFLEITHEGKPETIIMYCNKKYTVLESSQNFYNMVEYDNFLYNVDQSNGEINISINNPLALQDGIISVIDEWKTSYVPEDWNYTEYKENINDLTRILAYKEAIETFEKEREENIKSIFEDRTLLLFFPGTTYVNRDETTEDLLVLDSYYSATYNDNLTDKPTGDYCDKVFMKWD